MRELRGDRQRDRYSPGRPRRRLTGREGVGCRIGWRHRQSGHRQLPVRLSLHHRLGPAIPAREAGREHRRFRHSADSAAIRPEIAGRQETGACKTETCHSPGPHDKVQQEIKYEISHGSALMTPRNIECSVPSVCSVAGLWSSRMSLTACSGGTGGNRIRQPRQCRRAGLGFPNARAAHRDR